MTDKKVINIEGRSIRVIIENEHKYICLTDIAKRFGPSHTIISNWMDNGDTLAFLYIWETLYNDNFNKVNFETIKADVKKLLYPPRFKLSSAKWVRETNALGIKAKPGRYGGTYAHSDIAIQFVLNLNPEFHVYFIRELSKTIG